ncbi:hypothetical protein CRI93_13500 [Longimonas halophila]|uniref:Transporter n=1 Tax=Longimonas halophila TaxID=1469170 RepID=A0A2H3NIK2_9BACT|nr:hypothetical protein CRI93_13500 [Longimonas halophila]
MLSTTKRRTNSSDFLTTEPPGLEAPGGANRRGRGRRRGGGYREAFWCSILALCVAFGISVSATAQDLPYNDLLTEPAPDALTPLDDYFQEAVANNAALQAEYQDVVAQSNVGAQVGALPDPEVNLAFFANPPDQEGSLPGRLSGSVMQMTPWFGTRSARRSAADARTRALQQRLEQRALNLMRDVQATYVSYYRTQRAVELTERNLALLESLVPTVEARYETAQARSGQVDLLRIEMERDELRTRLASLRESRRPLRARFNELLNRAGDASIDLPEELPDMPLMLAGQQVQADAEAIADLLISRNPGLQSFDAQLRAAEHTERAARLDGWPQFGLGVQVMGRDFMQMRTMQRMNEGVALMATIQVPLFRGAYRAQQREATAQRRATRHRQTQQENELRTTIETHVQTYRDATRRIELHRERLLPRAAQALNILREDYQAGGSDIDEVIRMQRQMLDYAIALVEAQADQHTARARLEALAPMPNRPTPDFAP